MLYIALNYREKYLTVIQVRTYLNRHKIIYIASFALISIQIFLIRLIICYFLSMFCIVNKRLKNARQFFGLFVLIKNFRKYSNELIKLLQKSFSMEIVAFINVLGRRSDSMEVVAFSKVLARRSDIVKNLYKVHC